MQDIQKAPIIHSKVTYLEMNQDSGCEKADLGHLSLRRVLNMPVAEYLDLYREVGRDYLWNYRPGQTDSEIAAILNSPSTWMYVLLDGEKAVGMAELDANNPSDVELVHFGLLPHLLNAGLGKKFLQNVIRLVWDSGAKRMWLSTCDMDHPKAIRFYESAGFSVFKTKMGEFRDWRFTGFYQMSDAPQIPYGVKNPGEKQ